MFIRKIIINRWVYYTCWEVINELGKFQVLFDIRGSTFKIKILEDNDLVSKLTIDKKFPQDVLHGV